MLPVQNEQKGEPEREVTSYIEKEVSAVGFVDETRELKQIAHQFNKATTILKYLWFYLLVIVW